MLYDDDAGHKTFLEDVFENQNRLPAMSWNAASNQWTDVVGSTNHVIFFTDAFYERQIYRLPAWRFRLSHTRYSSTGRMGLGRRMAD